MRTTLFTLTFGIILALVLFVACSDTGKSVGSGANSLALSGDAGDAAPDVAKGDNDDQGEDNDDQGEDNNNQGDGGDGGDDDDDQGEDEQGDH
jgi:hypothetical protein